MEWAQIVDKFRQGDQDAFCLIYQRYFDDLYNFARYSVGAVNAEDVTQDVFLKVYKSCSQFRGESELKTWIFGIARRQIADWYRRKSFLPINWLGERVPDLEPGPEECYYINEQVRDILRELSQLGVRQRSIVVLREMYGFSTREVADIMGMSETNVRTILHRSIKHIKAKVTEVKWGGELHG